MTRPGAAASRRSGCHRKANPVRTHPTKANAHRVNRSKGTFARINLHRTGRPRTGLARARPLRVHPLEVNLPAMRSLAARGRRPSRKPRWGGTGSPVCSRTRTEAGRRDPRRCRAMRPAARLRQTCTQVGTG